MVGAALPPLLPPGMSDSKSRDGWGTSENIATVTIRIQTHQLIHIWSGHAIPDASNHSRCPSLQVAILDKEHFPRDKYCGDAVCTPAIRILDDMGVMKVSTGVSIRQT